MVGQATLAQRQRMVGLVAVWMSTSSQRWANLCISSECEVGWCSARQRWPNVGAWSDWSWSECWCRSSQRWANVSISSERDVGWWSARQRCPNVFAWSDWSRWECQRQTNVGQTYAIWMCATSRNGWPDNIGSTSLHGQIIDTVDRNVDVEPTFGQRMHFEGARRRPYICTLAYKYAQTVIKLATLTDKVFFEDRPHMTIIILNYIIFLPNPIFTQKKTHQKNSNFVKIRFFLKFWG